MVYRSLALQELLDGWLVRKSLVIRGLRFETGAPRELEGGN